MMNDEVRPLPVPNDEDREFWEAARSHRFVLPRCEPCGHVWFPPYAACPRCLSRERTWVEASGRGTIAGVARFHRQYLPSFPPVHTVVLVQLSEGPYVYANIVDSDPADAAVGLAVSVVFEDVTPEISLPQFRLAQAS
jgi:uncharacterized OB-fold protein